MADPKIGGASLEHDPRKPWFRRLVLWNTRRKPAAQQWLNEDAIRVLRDQCDHALRTIEADRAHAHELAEEILGNRKENA
jgi:hypothetical protein